MMKDAKYQVVEAHTGAALGVLVTEMFQQGWGAYGNPYCVDGTHCLGMVLFPEPPALQEKSQLPSSDSKPTTDATSTPQEQ